MNKIWLFLVTLLSLASCSGEQCIDADDFGFTNLTISARYSKNELSQQFGQEQVAPWRDSGYTVNGRPLTILVRGWTQGSDLNNSAELSAWCPWYGQSSNANNLSKFCERLRECQFVDDVMCTNTKDARITNAPCIFKKGVALYALIGAGGSDPNESFATEKNPQGVTFHLGEPAVGYQMLDIDKNGHTRQAGGLVYDYQHDDSLRQQYVNSSLYFKILDKFYDDNSGQYRVTIKSGINATDTDPISFVTNLVKNFLFGTNGDYGLIRSIYLGIVNNPGYRTAVSAMLSLYVMWTALSYLAGNVQVTQTELIIRVIKIAVVSALLSSQYSWTFFNDYLFVWFIGGVEQILGMIMEAGATGPGSSGILSMMLAPQTMAKLFSLLFVDWRGFIYIALFFFALYFVVMIYFDAAVIYLTALVAIGMIITMAPIFICFMLFNITRSLFDNWLKQLISYAVQPIILFTGLIFISIIVRQEIYGALGFRVCKQSFPEMGGAGGGAQVLSDFTRDNLGVNLGNSIFYWWFPSPMKGQNFTRTTANIPVPIDHFVSGTDIISANNTGQFCEAYGCIGARYVDLPFLDPVKDQRRIQQFWNGNFVQLDGMLLIFVAIYLLHKFNSLTISIAKFITNTSGNYTDTAGIAGGVSAGFRRRVSEVGGMVKNRFAKTEMGRNLSNFANKATQLKETAKQLPSMAIDKLRVDSLKKEALSGNPNQAVVQEAQKLSGLRLQDVKPNAVENYEHALKTELQNISKSLKDQDATNIAKKLATKKFSELSDEFAKAEFGKDYEKLTPQQQESIQARLSSATKYKLPVNPKITEGLQNTIAKEKYGTSKFSRLSSLEQESVKAEVAKYQSRTSTLRELADEAARAREYQEAYVDAYQALSNRGVGLVGKRVSIIRSLEELKNRADTKEQLREAKRQQIGEELYAGYENLKYGVYQQVTDGEKNPIGNTFAGGAWNEINTSKEAGNYRMQTYNEILADREKQIEHQTVKETIKNLSRDEGENVVNPEFIARAKLVRDPKVQNYEALAQEEVRYKVYEELSRGEDPAVKGEKFIKEIATEQDTAHIIDRAEQVKTQLLNEDEFVVRQEHYENRVEIAKDQLLEVTNELESHFSRSDVKEEELPGLYAKYLEDQGALPEEIQTKVSEVERNIEEFEVNQKILQEIDQRKADIVQEVDKHIDKVNEHRKQAGAPEHQSPAKNYGQVGIRTLRKIEDYKKP